jgi:hypothetical protein
LLTLSYRARNNSSVKRCGCESDAQVYNLNDIFDSLQSTFPPVASPVQNKCPDLEGKCTLTK